MGDLRLAARAICRTPVVSAAAVLSLALAMGANTAIFSVVNALLLRPLPVAEPHRLVTVSSGFALDHGFKAGAGMSYAMWRRMSERLRDFEGGFAWSAGSVDLSQGGQTDTADALFVSGEFFSTLRARPVIGRTLSAADDVPGGGRDGLVTVIGYGLWQRRFAGAADVVGRVLSVDGMPFTIVGITPPGFFGIEVGQPFDVVVPLGVEPALRGSRPSLHDPRSLMLTVMLRMNRTQSLESATATLRTMQPDILAGSGHLPAHLEEPFVLVPAATGTSDRSGLRRRYARPLLTVLAIVTLVVLVACVNIANLLLARAAARETEMGIRAALGASRWRLGRQLLVESLILSSAGAGAGLVFSRWASRALVAALATDETRVLLDLPLDWRVLGATAAASIGTAVLFGAAPAVRAGRVPSMSVLTARAHGPVDRAGRFGGLMALQIALSMILLVGAGLFVSTFARLAARPLGFDRAQVLVVEVNTARTGADSDARLDLQRHLLDAVSGTPGVTQAAVSSLTPFSRGTRSPLFQQPGRVHVHAVTPGFFEVYGIRLRSGRRFEPGDVAGAARVALVSEGYVRRHFPDGAALGHTIESGPDCDSRRSGACTVVGIVSDAVFASARAGAHPTIYVPYSQSSVSGSAQTVSLSLRSSGMAPGNLVPTIAAALTAVDRRLSFSFRPLEQVVDETLTQERVVARLSGFFAGLALLLSGIGLYGLVAFIAARRRRELAVRVALGATRSRLIALVLGRVAVMVGIGLAAGLGLSLWLSRIAAALLYESEPGDPATLLSAAVVLTSIAAVATAVPAFRGTLVDPAQALRQS